MELLPLCSGLSRTARRTTTVQTGFVFGTVLILTQEVLGRIRLVVGVFREVVDLLTHPFEVSCREKPQTSVGEDVSKDQDITNISTSSGGQELFKVLRLLSFSSLKTSGPPPGGWLEGSS